MFTIEKTDDTTGVLRNTLTDESIEGTLHNLDAYLKMLGQAQETIKLIRAAPDFDAARAALTDALGIDTSQADAILELRLSKITDLLRDHVLSEEERAKLEADRAEWAERGAARRAEWLAFREARWAEERAALEAQN